VGKGIELKSRDIRAIPVKSATHNNRCSMVCTLCYNQTWSTNTNDQTRSTKIQCKLPKTTRRSPPTT